MKNKILVAGGTGNLGGRIVRDLIKRGAEVRAIVRPETDSEKVEKLKQLGAEVISVDMSNADELKSSCQDVSCVVSALSGLRETIVEAQTQLLDAAIAAGVPSFNKYASGLNRAFNWVKDTYLRGTLSSRLMAKLL